MPTPPTRILVATDFSPCSRAAVEYGVELARAFPADLELLHAWFTTTFAGGVEATMEQWEAAPNMSVPEYVHASDRSALDKLAAEVTRTHAIVPRATLTFGDPRRVIVDATTADDLLVMGTHGLSGFARVILGSVAEHAVHHARCPVITVSCVVTANSKSSTEIRRRTALTP